jgi:hypothetical protein
MAMNDSLWTLPSNRFASRVDAMVADGRVVYAGSTDGEIFRSTDNGVTWVHLTNTFKRQDVNELLVSGNELYAAVDNGLYLSEDQGRTWTMISKGINGDAYHIVRAVVVKGDTVFVGTETGIHWSADRGNTWNTINEGLTSDPQLDWGAMSISIFWVCVFLFWLCNWGFAFFFLSGIPGGLKIFFINFIGSFLVTALALLIFSTRPSSGAWDFGNAERAVVILSAYALWGMIFLGYSAVRRRRWRINGA